MRYDGEPVRLGMRTTRPMLRASQPDKQNGTLSVHTIKASGHMHRSNRPNTRLHPTTTPKYQINPCNAGAIHTGHWKDGVQGNGPPFRISPNYGKSTLRQKRTFRSRGRNRPLTCHGICLWRLNVLDW